MVNLSRLSLQVSRETYSLPPMHRVITRNIVEKHGILDMGCRSSTPAPCERFRLKKWAPEPASKGPHSLPAALAGVPMPGPLKPGGLVDRILTATQRSTEKHQAAAGEPA